MHRFSSQLLNSLVTIVVPDTTANVKEFSNRNGSRMKITSNISTCDAPTVAKDKSKHLLEAGQALKRCHVVCFDVDSTVIREEGIDELAAFCGKRDEVARLTREAMQGAMTFQDALRMRLNIIRPSQNDIRDFLKAHPSTISTGIREMIGKLRANNTQVYLISGGFDCLIEPVAQDLGIPLENIFANKLMFYCNGEYAGFDVSQPTSHSGGKGEAIEIVRRKVAAESAVIAMVGDGATDLEAAPPADFFIGYGGNVIREEVRNRAKYFVMDFNELAQAYEDA